MKKFFSKKNSESGIALFMVISSVTLLAIVLAELTYSTQMNSRLAYNYVDGLKAYHLAKAGYKISLLRLKAYQSAAKFLNDPTNKNIKESTPKGILDKIWTVPFIFPIPITKEATLQQADAIKTFVKDSALPGSYMAVISSESTKLNLNNLFIKEAPAPSTATTGTNPTPNPTPTPTATVAVEFRPMLESTLTSLIENKKTNDREFAEVYRSVFGKDLTDAIFAYLFEGAQSSNLPGFKPIQPKKAPFYSLSELHLIPGLDDELFKVIEPSLTVYSTPGLNVNSISKETLQGLIPELTKEEAEDIIRKRDDPQVGQPWVNEEEFWKSFQETSAGKSLPTIKERFSKSNLKIIFEEQTFKIAVVANVGYATRKLEALVFLDTANKSSKKSPTPSENEAVNVAGQPSQPGQPGFQKPNVGVNLIYWRMQ